MCAGGQESSITWTVQVVDIFLQKYQARSSIPYVQSPGLYCPASSKAKTLPKECFMLRATRQGLVLTVSKLTSFTKNRGTRLPNSLRSYRSAVRVPPKAPLASGS